MSLVAAIIACICGQHGTFEYSELQKEQQWREREDAEIAHNVVELLYNSEKNGAELRDHLRGMIHQSGWTENLAKVILDKLDAAVRKGGTMSPALKEAFDKVNKTADTVGGFIKSHPVFCTVIVMGILVLFMPWVIEALGFAAGGPVEGSIAAAWQSRYAGYVPKGSLFSFFQRLGMKWHY